MDRVVIGMDPHKVSVTIGARDAREVLRARGRFGTGGRSYRHLLRFGRQQNIRLSRDQSPASSRSRTSVWRPKAGTVRTASPLRPGGPLKVAGAILSGARLCTNLAE